MKRTQIINIICSLLLASLLVLSVVLVAVFTSASGGKLVVASVSMQKEYDGAPLVAHYYEILSGELKNGHTIRASFSGSQTEVGVSDNTFTFKIIDSSGKDVTSSYTTERVYGKLTVIEKSNSPNTGVPGEFSQTVGGASSLDLGGRIAAVETGNMNTVCLRVKSDLYNAVYLKVKSFGAYTGQAWQNAREYDELMADGLSAAYLTSFAIPREDIPIQIKSFTDQYFLPYYMSPIDFAGYEKQVSDVLYSGDTENTYTVLYSRFDYQNAGSIPASLRTYEENYRDFVSSQYLEIDDSTRKYMERVILVNGFIGNDLETVKRVAEFIQNSAEYSLNYDRALDQEENIAVAFLSRYKQGICQHYATAATLLYRAMGIPARYTVGFTVNTRPGEWVEVKAKSAHAWVEVYIKGMGWVQVEVTSGFQGSGTDNQVKHTATVTPVPCEKQYDGTPLYAENKVVGFEKFEAMGYTYVAGINGSRTELGKSVSTIESFTIYDRNGNDVTDRFKIKYNPGMVHVYFSELVFTSEGQTKVYDGYSLSTDVSTCKMVAGTLREGDSFKIYSSVSEKYVVSVTNADFSVVIINQNGSYLNDVSDIYKITKQCGLLTITPREITITAGSSTKIFDHYHALTNHSYEITDGLLADGDYIYNCETVGFQYEVGRSDNVITDVIILNRFGFDVTLNYTIKLVPGVLEVRAPE